MAFSLDSSVHKNASTSTIVSPTLTTTAGSGQIVVCIGTNAASITSVTAPGLTFNVRKAYFAGTTFVGMAEYVANYTSNFSNAITVTLPTATFTTFDAVAIGNADNTPGISSPPFDSNVSLPATSSSASASGTTTAANTFVLASCGVGGATVSGSWLLVPNSGVDFLISMYQIVSVAGTYTPTATGGTIAGSFVDAFILPSDILSAQIWI